ncbi:unnamed protein product [Rhizoctonia solani]|uniref:CFEM domain-containing protein n=1 Tax=Rhizoctonia solani TaxID=456999 RepID=A0A8H3HSS2_9AGAM|nr:unnamed protein product [Rhizoctonia solani]
MQFITVALLAVASLTNAQSVPASAPGCVKYCLRIAREQTPSACNWAGWCATSGFQDSVTNCYSNICGSANQELGAQIYQQICSQAGSDTTCPSGSASASAPVSSAISSVSESATSVASSVASSASDVVTTIGGIATTIPASVTSSIADGLSSSAAQASSSVESASSSVASAISTATAPVSSAISAILSSAASVVSSATGGGASATQSSNAASALGLPSHGQVASLGAVFIGVAAGAFML